MLQDDAELGKLLQYLGARNLYNAMRDFLASEALGKPVGWTRIQAVIKQRAAAPHAGEFEERLESFIRDAVLVTGKRVYLLAEPVDIRALVPDLPGDVSRSYLSSVAPTRTEESLSWLFEERQLENAQIATFVTSRPVRQTNEVDLSELAASERERYQGARLIARYDVEMRCYDHLVRMGDTTVLLVDEPEGVDGAAVSRDEATYLMALRELMRVDPADPVFVDFFPAIEPLWRDQEEGIVNALEFVSNHRAVIRGKFGATSEENYREQAFQRGGESSGAQVAPYRIAVKWLNGPSTPLVILPGRAEMAIAATLGSNARMPLNHIRIPGYTSWSDFSFILDRVRNHLPHEKK